MNTEAIFSDGTREYRTPSEPEPGACMTLRLRTASDKGVRAFLVTTDKELPMQKEETCGAFSWFRIIVRLSEEMFSYLFRITQDSDSIFLDAEGLADEPRFGSAFRVMPGFSVPDWAKGAVMYQIFTDRFCNGDPDNDVTDAEYAYLGRPVLRVSDWNSPPESFDVCRFYGGDLEGVRQKLNYLKSLGVEVIYFNPLFVSPSNHKYDAQDYSHIDPHFGVIAIDRGEALPEGDTDNRHAARYRVRTTDLRNLEASDAFFARFVREAHERGIRVILDGVFNHCGSFHRWLDREGIYAAAPADQAGAFCTPDSPYQSFFSFDEADWPDNGSYEKWWGNETLPKLNHDGSERLVEEILSIAKKWVSPPYCCDGWRLDVAADLGHSEDFNHRFWKRFRAAVKEANPEAVILAEHYGDASPWLQGGEWDTVMNYDGFLEPVSWFLTGMEKHSEGFDENALCDGVRFEETMRRVNARFMTPSLLSAMNQLSNHDHSRFLTRTNHKVGRVSELGSAAAGEDVNRTLFRTAVLLQMTWPGAPTLYYGDEAGLCGFTDPDNRRTYPWGAEDHELIDFHRDMIAVHRMSPALRRGAFNFLSCGRNLVSFGRFTRDQQVVAAVNPGDCTVEVTLPVWKAQVPMDCTMEQVMITTDTGYSIMPVYHEVKDGLLTLSLRPFSGVVLRR